ncbi:MAG: hypothetical protein U9M97_03155 [Candidatus Hadarchaeota archaeon]|nr:hypothetical protein [Candidatus Hadarchaeota archaeon]
MRSVKIGEPQADMVKDLKKYLRDKEKLNATEADILTRAVDLAMHRHYSELVKELKAAKKGPKGVIQFVLENPIRGERTDAAKDHDLVGL